jgi:hypothetical protein
MPTIMKIRLFVAIAGIIASLVGLACIGVAGDGECVPIFLITLATSASLIP